jgi:hypothetical protein
VGVLSGEFALMPNSTLRKRQNRGDGLDCRSHDFGAMAVRRAELDLSRPVRVRADRAWSSHEDHVVWNP